MNTSKIKNYRGKVIVYYSNKGNVWRCPTGVLEDEHDKHKNVVKIKAKVDFIIAEYFQQFYVAPPIEYVKDKMLLYGKSTSISDIDVIWTGFITEKKKDVREETIEMWTWNFKKKLYEFVKEYNINFNDMIDDKFLEKWSNYLKEKTYNGKNYKDSYIKHYISLMKHFCEQCVDLKYIKKYDISDRVWKKYRSKSNGLVDNVKKNISLTQDELNFLKDKRGTLKTKNWNRTLDVFIFQCLTSLRYSDVCKINRTSIANNKLQMKSKKTTSDMIIDLSPTMVSILEDNDYNLMYSGRGNYNNVIHNIMKRIAEDCPSLCEYITIKEYRSGVEHTITKKKYEYVTSHFGRKTFVTINYENGEDIKDIIKYTGHAKGSKCIYDYVTDVKTDLNLSSKLDK